MLTQVNAKSTQSQIVIGWDENNVDSGHANVDSGHASVDSGHANVDSSHANVVRPM